MSEYKSYILRQMGISESDRKRDSKLEESFDPSEVAKGIAVEKEHTNDEVIAKRIAIDHLKEDPHYYSRMEKCGLKEFAPFSRISPTAKSPTVLAIGIKGSPGGMMPTSLLPSSTVSDGETGVDPKTPAALGGLELVNKQEPNTVTYDNTPVNSNLESAAPVADDVEPTPAIEHPSQVQQTEDEPVQSLTGTTDDDDDQMGDKPEPENFEVDNGEEDPESDFGLEDDAASMNVSLTSLTPKGAEEEGGDDVDVNVPDDDSNDEDEEEEKDDDSDDEDEENPHMVKEGQFEDWESGKIQHIKEPPSTRCNACGGSKEIYIGGKYTKCKTCNGTGKSYKGIKEECQCKNCNCNQMW